MKRRLLISILLLLSLPILRGQGLEINFQTGVGHYKMSDLKSILGFFDLPLDHQIVDEYPPYLFFQPDLAFTNDTFSIGLCYSFQSTGARISVEDYSGEYLMDSHVTSNALGILFKGRIISAGKMAMKLCMEAGPIWTTARYDESLVIRDDILFDEEIVFRSTALYLEPGISVSYTYGLTTAALHLGYCWQFWSKPLSNYNEAQILPPQSQENARADWTGIRYGISVGLIIQ